MFRVPDLEVDVAFKVVCKEPHPKFESYKTDRIIYMEKIVTTEALPRHRQISLQDCPAKVGIKTHLLPLIGFFSQLVATRADAVSDIIVDQPRFDRVKVNNTDGPSGHCVYHDIVHLRIAVNRTKMQHASFFGILKDMRPVFSISHKP